MSPPPEPSIPSGPILPRSSRDLVRAVSVTRRHPGLQLDKLSSAGEMKDQRTALVEVAECARDDKLLRALTARRREMFDAMGARRLDMVTRGPLTLHLSRSGALENAGIALHPVYGFVHLPGCGVKGLARAWAETVWAPAQPDAEGAWRRIERVFGWSAGSERHKKGWRPEAVEPPLGSSAGGIAFHDAWPLAWPPVELDVINNHHVDYYAGKDDPGDWENPTLVYFPAVGAGVEFEFALSARRPADDRLLELALEWLSVALQFEGAGAKTAAGYGRFKAVDAENEAAPPERLASARFDLRLAAPAFLAGAKQSCEDCDLRPATLRGLLRWWWRTLHAAHVDRDTLRRLETVVWGDAQAGGPVRLAVDFVSGAAPERHPGKDDRQFLDRHELQRPGRERKVTQGLFYASYGMAEGGSYRWLRPAGSTWRLTVTACDGRLATSPGSGPVPIPACQLLEQASAAVWLLVRFGGVGSRSRKGFGSFDDVEVAGIASVEDCLAAAARFRDAHRLPRGVERALDSPALEDVILMECLTPWRDPWFALDQVGMALQLFAKSRDGDDRIPLGLPRRIGRGRDARSLRAGRIDRHASPAIWSLGARDDGALTVRLAAFPAPRLPDREASEAALRDLVGFAKGELTEQAKRHPRAGQRPRPPDGTSRDPGAGPASSPTLEKGEFVEAVLLEERTRKGGWRARHEPTGKKMPIQNTGDVPGERKPGDRVELYVFSNDAFQWPTEDVRQAAERRRDAPQSPRRGGPRGRRR